MTLTINGKYLESRGGLKITGMSKRATDSVTARKAYVHQMVAAHGTGDGVLDLDDSAKGGAAGAYSSSDRPTVTGATPHQYVVFVNGQRMVSGSASDLSSGNVDYTLDSAGVNAKEIQFSFPLVAGDLIMVDKTTVS